MQIIKTLSLIALNAALSAAPRAANIPAEGNNLVENPGFEEVDGANRQPPGWESAAPRAELEPLFGVDTSVSRSGDRSARIVAGNNPGVIGYWVNTVPGILAGEGPDSRPSAPTVRGDEFLSERSYRIRCYFRVSDIESVNKSVWIRANWLDHRGDEVLTEYVSRFVKEDEWYRVEQTSRAPRAARSLKVELVLRWAPGGTIWWDDLSVAEVPTPAPRKVRVAAASYTPAYPSTPDENRRFFAEKVVAAGRLGADLICLGEGITLVSTGRDFDSVAETVPGPTSRIMGEAAREAGIYVVVGIYEREGSLIYNTALLIDRSGQLVGKYRKTHLPETEITGGLTPGDTYPVFQTDFGVVGIEICYDYVFPEVTRSLALKGAELILLPIWGDLRSQGYAWDIIARARAIDNAVYLVASIYSNHRSLIINPDGRILADSGTADGLITADINLDSHTYERWLSVESYGEWKNLYGPERRGETYRDLQK